MTDSFPESLFARARELKNVGIDRLQAHSIAWLEERIRKWPSAWGDDLHVLLYGDFQAPPSTLEYPTLGITIHPDKKDNTIIRGALTVLEATVIVQEKSIPALIDAAKRINILLGTYTLHAWGNAVYGWWSWVTHDTVAGALTKLTYDGIEQTTSSILKLPPEVRRKVDAGLFWVREPRHLLLESYRPDVLRIYSAYWNAFECLVEAVNILKPRPTPTKVEKQAQINEFVQKRGGQLTTKDIEQCYQTIVNPGFVGKALHALTVCFGNQGESYAEECFRLSPQEDRLYAIRNAINHGDIDAENPNELIRVEARLTRLWMIVWRMFSCFIPFPAPGDLKEAE
jgi:hypothetical protein